MVVRAAVIGAGVVSGVHLSGIKKNPRTTLVGVCDLDRERANEAAFEYGTRAYYDLEELLDSARVDCLHVCTPAQTHVPIATQAIERGTAVLIEKPVATTTAEVETLQERASEYDVPASVVHNHLFSPVARRVRRMIQKGSVGQLRAVDVTYSGLTSPDEVHRGSWTRDLDGGEFEEGIPHPIYTTLGLGGYPDAAESVQSMTHLTSSYDGEFTYDGAQVQYRSENGALCNVKLLTDARPQRYAVVHGTDRSLIVDFVTNSLQVIDEDYERSSVARVKKSVDTAVGQVVGTAANVKRVLEATVRDDWESQLYKPHYYVFDRMARALEHDTPVPTPLEESWWTIRLIESIREAATTDPIGVRSR